MKICRLSVVVASLFLAGIFHVRGTASEIRLAGGVIDTSAAVAKSKKTGRHTDKIAAERPAVAPARGTLPYIVQFAGPIRAEWKAALKSAGAEIKFYLPENAFVVLADPGSLDAIAKIADVQWIGEYRAEYKMQPRLKARAATPAPAVDRKAAAQSPAEASAAAASIGVVTILTFRPEDAGRVAQAVAAAGGQVLRESRGGRRGLIRAQVPLAAVESLAALGEVEWIEDYVPRELHNNVAQESPRMNAAAVQADYGLTAAGQVVGIADTGFDTGNLGTLHPDFTNRVKAAFALGRPGDWSDPDGHGTHTAGSLAGDGRAYSNGLFHGVAYGARLVMQSVMDEYGSLGGVPADLNDLFLQAYTNDARIHSDSWGSSMNGCYNVDSANADAFMWNHPDMLVVFSAGNEGRDGDRDGVIDWQRMGTPGTAKNVLTVGASESHRPDGSGGYSSYTWGTEGWKYYYPVPPISDDLISTSADGLRQGMAAFSSRGPCNDGRIKPDIVAPGTDIVSCRSRVSGAGTAWGTGSGILGNSASNYYMFSGGTSMSTPLTAGAAAIARQYLMQLRGFTNPCAALVKAALIAGAKSLTPGQYGTGAEREVPGAPRPNNVEGWGQVNLGASLFPGAGHTNMFYDGTNALATGGAHTYTFNVTRTGRVSVILAWTDYPGSEAAAVQLVNDLDLVVITPGGTTNYAFGRSGFDRINNVEGIDLDPAPIGALTIKVIGYNIPQGPQPYALAIRSASVSAPAKASGPEPADGETGVARGAKMSWGNAGGATSFDVYFGTNASPGAGEFMGAQEATWFDPGSLRYRTTYYWRVDAHTSGGTRTGEVWSFTTEAPALLSERFEHDGGMPPGWSQEYDVGGQDWVFISGGWPNQHTPSGAHGGSYNAAFYSSDDDCTRLVTPPINFRMFTNHTELTFWHYMEDWLEDQDTLSIYYRTNAEAAWVLLTNYATCTTPWTKRTVILPAPGTNYFIAFEGVADYGFGVCIDDVLVTGMGEAGTLQGVVTNMLTGQAIEGARIALTNSGDSTLSLGSGEYSIFLAPGTHWAVVSAQNYATSAAVSVTITLDGVTTRNFALTPIPLQVAPTSGCSFAGDEGGPFAPTGYVYSLTNASLAPLTWTAQCDAAWVELSVSGGVLAAGAVLPVTVSLNDEAAVMAGGAYAATVVFSNMTDGGTAARAVDLAIQLPLLMTSDFSAGLPAGWSIVGSSAKWRFDDPGKRGNRTGGSNGFAIADSDYAGEVNMDTELRTPVVDCSALKAAEFSFRNDFNSYDVEIADVDVSVNGAAGPWVNLWRKTEEDYRGPTNIVLDVSSQVAGQANVMFRFRYHNANYDWWWQVDDVVLSGITGGNPCIVPSAGLNASGYHGGPFAPERVYQLANTNLLSLSWTSLCSQAWLDVTPSYGYLDSAGWVRVTAQANASAASLAPGVYTNRLVFSNITDGTTQERTATLTVHEPMTVSPSNGLASSGYMGEGDSFAPTNIVYTLTNAGDNALTWSAAQTQAWAALSAPGGVLAAGASAEVTVSIVAAEAGSLAAGSYESAVIFSNETSGTAYSRAAALTVLPQPGNIEVLDSIPPYNDTNMPFGVVQLRQSRTEQITITNADSSYPLVITNIAVRMLAGTNGGAGAGGWGAAGAGLVANPGKAVFTERAPAKKREPLRGEDPTPAPSTVPCYGLDLHEDSLVSFSSATPGTLMTIKDGPADYFACDFLNGDFSKLYALHYYSNTLVSIDTTTGDITLIGPAVPATGFHWTGLAGDPVDGTLYAVANYKLYRINPNTGEATFITDISRPGTYIGIAINAEGKMYGVDITWDRLVAIDKTTGVGTIIGPLGINANYAQGLDFDEANDILYWAAYYSGGGALRVLDTATGASRLVGEFQSDDEMEMAVANGGGAVFSFSNAPALPCSIPANGSMTFDVTYRPQAALSNRAEVLIDSNDRYAPRVAVALSGQGEKLTQTIAFANPGPQIATNTVSLAATASSALPVSFVVGSGPGTIESNNSLTFTAAGTVAVVAVQAGNAIWSAALNVTSTFNVAKAPAQVTLHNLNQTYNGAPRIVNAVSVPTGLTVALTYNGQAAPPVNAGAYAVTGTVASAIYQGQTKAMLAIAKAAQTVVFPAIPDQMVTNTVKLSATASSGLSVAFAVSSGPGKIAGGNRLTFTAAGTVAIAAAQAGNSNWNAAATATNVIIVQEVGPAPPAGISASDGKYTDKVRVSWEAAARAASYEVWRHTAPDASAARKIGQTALRWYDDLTARNQMTYYYWVKAVNTAGTSAFSEFDTGYLAEVGPLVSVNGMVGDNVCLPAGTPITITLEMMNLPAEYIGYNVDWWVAAYAHNGNLWYYLSRDMAFIEFDGNLANCQPAYQGPLMNMPRIVLAQGMVLPPGVYNLWFAVDYPMDGILRLDGPILVSQLTLTLE